MRNFHHFIQNIIDNLLQSYFNYYFIKNEKIDYPKIKSYFQEYKKNLYNLEFKI